MFEMISQSRINQEISIEDMFNSMDDSTKHISVMREEIISYLQPRQGGCFVDATLGLGGHAHAIGELIASTGHLICIDRDKESIAIAKENLKDLNCHCDFIHEDFRNIHKILDDLKIEKVDGILLDLGISSFQLNNPLRGFSIKLDGPLDMRMDQESYISAFDLVNSLSENEISSILRNFGEERWHHRIAHKLVEQRLKHPIQSTKDLSDSVLNAVPFSYRKQKIHPATRTFQAFRIAVNRELESLEMALGSCIQRLRQGARICVISFHSLEDRIVKMKFRQLSQEGEIKLIVKKPQRPTMEEVNSNPRARSAKLRVAEKVA